MKIKQFQNLMIKKFFKVELVSTAPGRLRFRIRNYAYLQQELLAPYIPAMKSLLLQVTGVNSVDVNPKTGSILLLYNTQLTTSSEIQQRIEQMIDVGFSLSEEVEPNSQTPEELEKLYVKKLGSK